MKNRLISILLNPYFIAFGIALGTIAFLPNYFLKYNMALKSQASFQKENECVFYADLNNDNKSEKIVCFDNVSRQACFNIFSAGGDLLDQWNFNGYYPDGVKTLWFLDANNNGFNEIYLVTQKKDSAFLNIIEPFVKKGIDKRHIFIDLIQPFNKTYKFSASTKAFILKSGIENEVVFTLETGFSGSPRNAYKYNLNQDKIYKSPHLTNKSNIHQVIDIDNDGLSEILLINHSAGNKIDTVFTKRTDNSTWLMLLNNNLSFRFKPIEFRALFSGLHPIAFKDKNTYKIICLLNSKQLQLKPTKLFIYTTSGVKLKEKELPSFGKNNHLFLNSAKKTIIIHDKKSGKIKEFNYDLKEINSFTVKPNNHLYPIDIDKDGKKEWLNLASSNKSVTVYRENFDYPVSIKIPKQGIEKLYFGLKQISKHKNDLYFQKGNEYYVYGYTQNPLYFFKYLIFLGVYLLVLSLVFLIIKGQKYREAKKTAIEKKIAELQIKTIKNQVDPHFVFNAVNTMSAMLLEDDKLAADDFICKFSDLMRKTLNQSDKITNSIKEEVDYIINYLELQKIRYNNRFTYQIDIDKKVDTNFIIPKLVLFTYVENALKHGLSNKDKGLLKISIKYKGNNLFLCVEDNGGGLRKQLQNKKISTGNGLKINEKIYKLYNKLYNRKIDHQLIELKDNNGLVRGLKIEILIPK